MTTEELKNVAGFKAVDAEGNELGVVSLSDIVSAVKQELQPSGVARASVAALSEVSAQAATDTYEDQLPQKTDVTWIRGLDESGNPILISKQSLVSVAEGLIFKFNRNAYYKTIFKEVRSEDGSWDDLYDCLFALYRVGVPGSSPFGIIGGNQSVVLNVYCGPQFCGQFAFGFNSNKIAFRNRINLTSWGEWIQV